VAQEQALQKPHGRRIGSWKRKAREALPHATLQEQAEHANQLAKRDGYLLHLNADQMQLPKARHPPVTEANAEPTLAQLMQVATLAKGQGGVGPLLDKVRAVDELARQVGGLANLHAWLEILLKLQGGD
jgi:hypothetical protein